MMFEPPELSRRPVQLRTRPSWVAPTIVGPLSPSKRDHGISTPVYRLDGKTWRYTWKTTKSMAGSVWQIGTTLDDGETHIVTIALR